MFQQPICIKHYDHTSYPLLFTGLPMASLHPVIDTQLMLADVGNHVNLIQLHLDTQMLYHNMLLQGSSHVDIYRSLTIEVRVVFRKHVGKEKWK